MKILWITGALLPEATAAIKGSSAEGWSSTGSWILGAAAAITQQPGIQLYMAATSQIVTKLTRVETGRIISYAIPYGRGHFEKTSCYDSYMKEIHDEVQPDIVHIHGTEYSHSEAYLRINGGQNTVISIQGMTTACAETYHRGMSTLDTLRYYSFRDLLRGGILSQQHSFRRRGEFEKAMLRNVGHVIGRTTWDKAQVMAINPNLVYHCCNETLRSAFYEPQHWNYAACTPHSIFVSQAYYPLKGFHQLLKALPVVLRCYPDVQVRVAGLNPLAPQWWRITSYGRYLKRLIRKGALGEHVTFIGEQDTAQMKDELLKCNLFLCPSSIENSPNSLGEAQILGVPCVASCVGGVPDMMKGCEDNLYPFDDVEMLADRICIVFENKEEQKDMSSMAVHRHDPKKNVDDLLQIYHEILSDNT